MRANGTPLSSGEGKQSAAASPPDPEVAAKATRRRFTTASSCRSLKQAHTCETALRDRRTASARTAVQFAPVGVEGGAGGVIEGAGEEARASSSMSMEELRDCWV